MSGAPSLSNIGVALSREACEHLEARATILPSGVRAYLDKRRAWDSGDHDNEQQPYLAVNEIQQLFKAWPAEEEIHFHELVEEAVVIFPSLPTLPKNPELQARLEKLKQEQENKDYVNMVKNVDPQFSRKSEESTSLTSDIKTIRAQLIAVTNFIVSIVGTFAFVYKAMEYALPEPKVAAQVMAGLLGSSIVALAELYFLVRQLDS